MSSGFTVYGMALIMRSIFTPDSVSVPVNFEFAGCLTIPVMNSSPDQLYEPEPSLGYSRANVAPGSASWGVSDFGEIYNLTMLGLGTPTQYWGPLYGWALIDPDLGEVINVGEFIDPIDPVVGQLAVVEPASIVVGLYG